MGGLNTIELKDGLSGRFCYVFSTNIFKNKKKNTAKPLSNFKIIKDIKSMIIIANAQHKLWSRQYSLYFRYI